MKLFLLLFFSLSLSAAEIPVLTVADTINPGTADYIIHGIEQAEAQNRAFVVLQLDTPGGLLPTTRQIVQAMLNAKIPVVVFVGPKGAHAGSAGALITFGSDIAAMAPGTNIGAAHPVPAGGGEMDKVMSDKVANDVSAFAESLAKTKGRNTDWAVKAVRNSESLTADQALKTGVVDLMAENVDDLLAKLAGYKLRVPKHGVAELPAEAGKAFAVAPTIKHRVVSFFADPNLAYMIMSLGALCIWVELTHPGLIFPGILGALCIIVSLVSFQTLPIDYGALALIFLGIILLVVEMFVPSFGVLGIGGLVAFVMGSLYLMDTNVPEFQISLGLIFPTAAALAAFSFFLGWLVLKAQKRRNLSGLDALVGEFAEVKEPVSEKPGKVFVSGELWNAVTAGEEIPTGAIAKVTGVRQMTLVVERK